MEQILFIHKNKTSALIEACMMIGAVLAGASKEDVMAMEECGEYIGPVSYTHLENKARIKP